MIYLRKYNENKMEIVEDCLLDIFDELSIDGGKYPQERKTGRPYYFVTDSLIIVDLIPLKDLSNVYSKIVRMKNLIEKRTGIEIDIEKRTGSSNGYISISISLKYKYMKQFIANENKNNYDWPNDKIDELADCLQEFFDKYNIKQKNQSDVYYSRDFDDPFWFIATEKKENKSKRRENKKILPKYLNYKRYITIDIDPSSIFNKKLKYNIMEIISDIENRRELIEKRLKSKIEIECYRSTGIIYIKVE